uniref:CX domain-containing protein n=1 Tax=Macrostomum lignano TaxID=282301 RepID=A0A1I8HBP1_9PLAT
ASPLYSKGVPRTKGAGSRAGGSTRKNSRYGSSGSGGFSSLPMLIRSRFSFLAKYTAYRLGIILASKDWRAAHPEYSDSMTLCFSVRHDLPSWLNDSVMQPWLYQNRTVLGLHVCPLDNQLDKVYCCGFKDGQECCTFWDDFSRLSSVVVGVALAGISCSVFAAWLFRWSRRQLSWRSGAGSRASLFSARNQAMDEAASLPTGPEECSYSSSGAPAPRKVGVRRKGPPTTA